MIHPVSALSRLVASHVIGACLCCLLFGTTMLSPQYSASQDKTRIAAESAERAGVQEKKNSPGKWQEAIAKFEEALTLWRQLGDRQGELRMLARLGREYINIGEPLKALKYYQEALPLARASDDRYEEANLLMGFGAAYYRQNEGQKAFDAFNQARQIFTSISRGDREADAIGYIGLLYLSLGDLEKSLEYSKQALRISTSLKLPRRQCDTLSNLGTAYHRMGWMREAHESFNQALALAREHRITDYEGRVLRHLGYFYFNRGESGKALESFNDALKLCSAVGNRVCEATVLRGIASVSQLSGENEKALDFLGQALHKFRLSGERSREAVTLHQMAQVNQELGKLNEASRQAEQALDIMESVRADVVNQHLRESFFVSAQRRFALYIDLLMQLHQQDPAAGHDAQALQASERARARGLLEQLAESNVDLRQGVDPQLLERERTLQQQLNAKAAARTNASNDNETESLSKAFDKEIAELTSRYREVEAQIRASSPSYVALTRPEPLAAVEIQRKVLDENTVLLEFALGEKRSWLWAITPDAITSHALPARSEIEASARKIYELLTARQLIKGESAAERETRIADVDLNFTKESGILGQMLLGGIADKLRLEWKEKRLLIVAGGALEYLPFTVLPSPSTGQPLIADHEVVNLPSASVLSAIRREAGGRQPAVKAVAVLADPVFEANDPRVRMAAKRGPTGRDMAVNTRSAESAKSAESAESRGQSQPSSTNSTDTPLMRSISSLGRSVNETNGRGSLSRLPFSHEEAQAITSLVPAKSFLKATGFRASRATALSGELSNYRIVHFATHGIINSEHPELSGLVLSLIDEHGRTQDGFLRMHEIFNLRMPADVVVLSACQTALGKEIRGEGLIGLTRGFMYAGAQRVVASLWQVDDLATAELMKRFYRGMLKDGMRPAAALRAAQLEMMKQKRWAAPYFWAGFIMQGEH